jgi:hypothetical protein
VLSYRTVSLSVTDCHEQCPKIEQEQCLVPLVAQLVFHHNDILVFLLHENPRQIALLEKDLKLKNVQKLINDVIPKRFTKMLSV